MIPEIEHDAKQAASGAAGLDADPALHEAVRKLEEIRDAAGENAKPAWELRLVHELDRSEWLQAIEDLALQREDGRAESQPSSPGARVEEAMRPSPL